MPEKIIVIINNIKLDNVYIKVINSTAVCSVEKALVIYSPIEPAS